MKRFIYLFILSFISLTSCHKKDLSNMTNSSSTNIISSLDYDNFLNIEIDFSNMYNINKEKYAIYFYSEYCPVCFNLKDDLFNYLKLDNKIIPNFYLINIDIINENEFSKMQWVHRMTDEEILKKTLNATSIEETFFKSAPAIYVIENKGGINTLVDALLSYSTIYNFFTNNVL